MIETLLRLVTLIWPLGRCVRVMAMGVMIAGTPAIAQQIGSSPASQVLLDPAAEHEQRREAARVLMASGRDAAIGMVRDALRRDEPAGARRACLEAVCSMDMPPNAVLHSVIEVLANANAEQAPEVLAALKRYHEKRAVAAVFQFADRLGSPISPALEAAITDTLQGQTGFLTPGARLEAWRRWWEVANAAPDSEWNAWVLNTMGARADKLAIEREQAIRKLLDVYGRLSRTTPAEERPALMAEMMRDSLQEVRLAGFDLASRALLNAQPISDAVIEAATGALADPVADVRVAAATMLERLDRPDAVPALLAAMDVETSAAPAGAMLRVLARYRDPRSLEYALRWFERDGTARQAGASVVLALLEAGSPIDEKALARIKAILSTISPRERSSASLALSARLGLERDVLGLLRDSDARVAVAAAQAIRPLPDSLDDLVSAARANPAIAEVAVSAISLHEPTAEGYAIAMALPTADQEARNRAIVELIRRLPSAELLKVARAEQDVSRREQVLNQISQPAYFQNANGSRALDDDYVQIVSELVELRIRAERANEARALFDALPATWVQDPQIAMMKLRTLLMLDELDEGADLTRTLRLPPDLWLEALQRRYQTALGPRLFAMIRALYPDGLSPEAEQRLNRILERGGHPPEIDEEEATGTEPGGDSSG